MHYSSRGSWRIADVVSRWGSLPLAAAALAIVAVVGSGCGAASPETTDALAGLSLSKPSPDSAEIQPFGQTSIDSLAPTTSGGNGTGVETSIAGQVDGEGVALPVPSGVVATTIQADGATTTVASVGTVPAGSLTETTPAAPGGAVGDDGAPKPSFLPNISLTRLSDGHGVNVRTDLAGGDTPILFWLFSPTCSACRFEVPVVESLSVERPNDIRVVVVANKATVEEAQDWLVASGADRVEVWFDDDLSIMQEYGLSAFPSTVLLDPQGNVLQTWRGTFHEGELLRLIG